MATVLQEPRCVMYYDNHATTHFPSNTTSKMSLSTRLIELSDLGNEAAFTVVDAVNGKVFRNAHTIRRETPPMCYVSNIFVTGIGAMGLRYPSLDHYGTALYGRQGAYRVALDSQVGMEVAIPVRIYTTVCGRGIRY